MNTLLALNNERRSIAMTTPKNDSSSMEIVTLGVAAGPAIRGRENGMSTAIVVNGSFYLVDFGLGCTRALHEAGLRGKNFRAGFITHLHSDHVAELPGFLLWNWGKPVEGFEERFEIHGPGIDTAEELRGLDLQGTSGLLASLQRAFSYDMHIRVADEGRPPFTELIDARDIAVPAAGDDSIFEVYRDENVRVTAVLVEHPPVFPALAFRFDSEHGSVVISGDTAESMALMKLAEGCDILVHEAVNLEFYHSKGFDPAFIAHQTNSHSTPQVAGKVAALAGAKQLVLSHLAGEGTPEFWGSGAAETYSGPITVATSGQRFAIPTEA